MYVCVLQVLEIAALPDHLLDECDHRADYVACDVTGQLYRRHINKY